MVELEWRDAGFRALGAGDPASLKLRRASWVLGAGGWALGAGFRSEVRSQREEGWPASISHDCTGVSDTSLKYFLVHFLQHCLIGFSVRPAVAK